MVNDNSKQADEPIVIADECGDSMWDEVLKQETRSCLVPQTAHSPGTLNTNPENVPVVGVAPVNGQV